MNIVRDLRIIRQLGPAFSLRSRIAWVRRLTRFRRAVQRGTVEPTGPAEFTAIILSYKRPQNIQPIVESMLRTPSVRRVIISQNNPDYALEPWLQKLDPRVTLLKHPFRRSPAHRYHLARSLKDDHFFFSVDDDFFLLPSQIERLCSVVRGDPSRPHGVFGQRHDSWRGLTYHGQTGQESVDVLNRAYAFTTDHIAAMDRLLRELGIGIRHPAWNASLWDDMVLSFSGAQPPVIHDVGSLLDCPTADKPGLAVFKRPGFFDFRLLLFQDLRRHRPHLR